MRNNEKSHFVWKQRRSEDEECAGWGEDMLTWHGDDNLYNTRPWPAFGRGPRMDRRAVTCLGVVKISRLALRLWRSAPRGPDPTAVLIKLLLLPACQEGVSQNCY